MMKELYEMIPSVRDVFLTADHVLNRGISQLCFEGSAEELNLTHNTQPCMLACDLAAGIALKAAGVVPDAIAGFSLGEYAALTFAGVMTMDEAFRIIQLRADAMQRAVSIGNGSMAAIIGAKAEEVEEICKRASKGYVAPSNYNNIYQTVVSGVQSGVEEVMMLAEERGFQCVKLAVSAPFHCRLMEPARRELKSALSHYRLKESQIPIYMNVTGESVVDPDAISDYLIKQTIMPVQWTKTLKNMKKAGIDTFVVCGPGKTLSDLVKATLRRVSVHKVENAESLRKTLEALGTMADEDL